MCPYPNEYCNPCNPAPQPCVNPPEPCEGTPCEEIVLSQCVMYNGPAIECFNITEEVIEAGLTMSEFMVIISQAVCGCLAPQYTVETTEDSITITITNALTSADYFEVSYKEDGASTYIAVPTVPGQIEIAIEDLECDTYYNVKVEKVCVYPDGKSDEIVQTITTQPCP